MNNYYNRRYCLKMMVVVLFCSIIIIHGNESVSLENNSQLYSETTMSSFGVPVSVVPVMDSWVESTQSSNLGSIPLKASERLNCDPIGGTPGGNRYITGFYLSGSTVIDSILKIDVDLANLYVAHLADSNCTDHWLWPSKNQNYNSDQQRRGLMIFYSLTFFRKCYTNLINRLAQEGVNEQTLLLLLIGSSNTKVDERLKTEIVRNIAEINSKLGDVHLDAMIVNTFDGYLNSFLSEGRPSLFSNQSSTVWRCSILTNQSWLASASSSSGGASLSIGSGGVSGESQTPDVNVITSFSRTSVLFVSVSFIVLMVISLAWLVFYYVQRYRMSHAKNRLARRLFNAAKKVLAKMSAKTIKPGDKELGSDCPVCIEPFLTGDVVRTLPCKHFFHKTCVDPWLLEHRTCPMCKLDILKAYGYNIGHSEESVRDGDQISAGGQSTDGARSNTMNFPGGLATDSDMHDPFFPSPAPSPSMLQPVLRSDNALAFSIIPLTVHCQSASDKFPLAQQLAAAPSTSMGAATVPGVVERRSSDSSADGIQPCPLQVQPSAAEIHRAVATCASFSDCSSDDGVGTSGEAAANRKPLMSSANAASRRPFTALAVAARNGSGATMTVLASVNNNNNSGKRRGNTAIGRPRWLNLGDKKVQQSGSSAARHKKSAPSRPATMLDMLESNNNNSEAASAKPRSASTHDICSSVIVDPPLQSHLIPAIVTVNQHVTSSLESL